jgi:hypothetical protein
MVIVLIPIAEECPRRGQFDWNIIRVAAGIPWAFLWGGQQLVEIDIGRGRLDGCG